VTSPVEQSEPKKNSQYDVKIVRDMSGGEKKTSKGGEMSDWVNNQILLWKRGVPIKELWASRIGFGTIRRCRRKAIRGCARRLSGRSEC